MSKLIAGGLTVLLLNCGTQYFSPKQYSPEAKVELAQCLVKKEAIMYGAYWCGYCTKEKETFGPAWEVMQKNYVECTDKANSERCSEVAVNHQLSFPTWKFKNGKVVRGYTPNFLEVLARESGCD